MLVSKLFPNAYFFQLVSVAKLSALPKNMARILGDIKFILFSQRLRNWDMFFGQTSCAAILNIIQAKEKTGKIDPQLINYTVISVDVT